MITIGPLVRWVCLILGCGMIREFPSFVFFSSKLTVHSSFFTHPNEPGVDYPEGFQENYIPVDGPTVAKLIEDRIDGKIGTM